MGRQGWRGGRERRAAHLVPPALSFSGAARREVLILVLAVVNNAADVDGLDRKAWWRRAGGVCGRRWGSGEAGRRKAWVTQRKSGSSRNGLLVILVMMCLYSMCGRIV